MMLEDEEIILTLAKKIIVAEETLSKLKAEFSQRLTAAKKPEISAAAQIRTYFEERVGEPVELKKLVTDMRALGPQTVRATVARFAKEGKLKNVERGQYAWK